MIISAIIGWLCLFLFFFIPVAISWYEALYKRRNASRSQ